MKRRNFLSVATTGLLASSLPVIGQTAPKSKKRVAIIGHTGRGDFGHGLDSVWLRFPETEIVAVADADKTGLANKKKQLNVKQGFTDYREMLQKMKPEFVAVCTRHADQHLEMTLAAIEAGTKGIYIEKPFCRTPEEADQLIESCKKQNAKIAVAHRNRYHPALKVISKLIAEGQVGRILEIRCRGKGDRRGGGEDLWVLGSHVLNLMAYFGGKPNSCSAVMMQDGRRVTKNDVRDGAEGLGPLAGNELHARYEMTNGIVGYFDSIANDGTKNAGFGLQIIGSEGIIAIRADREPLAHLIPGNPFLPTQKPRPWIPISTAGVGKPELQGKLISKVQHHDVAVQDLIDACKSNREPLCNVHEGALIVEMICAVFESHRQNSSAVSFPLQQRKNALHLL